LILGYEFAIESIADQSLDSDCVVMGNSIGFFDSGYLYVDFNCFLASRLYRRDLLI